MALTTVVTFALMGTTGSKSIETTVDVGTAADRVALVMVGGSAASPYTCMPDHVTVGAETLAYATTAFNPYQNNNWKLFYGPITGTSSQLVKAYYGASDYPSQPHMIGIVCSGADAATIAANIAFSNDIDGNNAWSKSVTSALGDLAVCFIETTAAHTPTATNGTVQSGTGLTPPSQLHAITRAGTGGATTLSGTWDSGTFEGANVVFSVLAKATAPVISGAASLDDVGATGTLATAPPSALSGDAPLDPELAAGGVAVAQGTCTTPPLKRNNGTVAANVTFAWLAARLAATGVPVLLRNGDTTDTSGVVTISSVQLVAGTTYTLEWLESTGERGRCTVLAA